MLMLRTVPRGLVAVWIWALLSSSYFNVVQKMFVTSDLMKSLSANSSAGENNKARRGAWVEGRERQFYLRGPQERVEEDTDRAGTTRETKMAGKATRGWDADEK